MTQREDAAIACHLDALDTEGRARRAKLAGEVVGAAHEVVEIPGGYALHLAATPGHCRDAFEWFMLERLCCPFLRLEIDLEPGDRGLRLRLSGGRGVKEFLGNAGLARMVGDAGASGESAPGSSV